MGVDYALDTGSRDVFEPADWQGGLLCHGGMSVPEQNPDSIHADPLAPVTRCSVCGKAATRSPCGPCNWQRDRERKQAARRKG